MERLAWIEVLEVKPVSVGHPKGFRETSCPLDDVLRTHGLHSHSESHADIASIVVLSYTAIISLASTFGHSGTIPGDPHLATTPRSCFTGRFSQSRTGATL